MSTRVTLHLNWIFKYEAEVIVDWLTNIVGADTWSFEIYNDLEDNKQKLQVVFDNECDAEMFLLRFGP